MIKIITPNITATSENNFNLSICEHDDELINHVKHHHDNKYVIANKDGSVPDIELDEETIDLIIEARSKYNIMRIAVNFYQNNNKYDSAILLDTSLLTRIVSDCPNYTTDRIYSYLENLPAQSDAVKKYLRA